MWNAEAPDKAFGALWANQGMSRPDLPILPLRQDVLLSNALFEEIEDGLSLFRIFDCRRTSYENIVETMIFRKSLAWKSRLTLFLSELNALGSFYPIWSS
eukprot:symbB.v1.2.002609.t1/scaffold135.1/size305288/29